MVPHVEEKFRIQASRRRLTRDLEGDPLRSQRLRMALTAPNVEDPEVWHAHEWKAVLAACVRPATVVRGQSINAVEYSMLYAGSAAREALDEYLRLLASVNSERASLLPPARKALLINAYNAFTINLIVRRFDASSGHRSITDLGSEAEPIWRQPVATLAGEHVSLDEVEKGPNGLLPNFSDARLHAAVVYASVYCPDLAEEPFTVANMDHLLDERCRSWLAHTQKGLLLDDKGVLTLSPIFEWYRSDFDALAASCAATAVVTSAVSWRTSLPQQLPGSFSSYQRKPLPRRRCNTSHMIGT
jgi:hypothetical protein